MSQSPKSKRSPSPEKLSGSALRSHALRLLARREHSRRELQRKLAALAAEPDEVERILDELTARGWLAEEQVPPDRHRFERAADLRYEHQSFELTCALGEGPLTPAHLEALLAGFHAEARRVAGTQPSWMTVLLLAPDGRQLVSSRMPWGAPLPPANHGALAANVPQLGRIPEVSRCRNWIAGCP